VSPGVVAAVVVVVVMVAAAQLVEITAPETVDPLYKALTRSSAAPSPNHNVLREERPAKRVRQQRCGIEGRRRLLGSVPYSMKSSWTDGPPSDTQTHNRYSGPVSHEAGQRVRAEVTTAPNVGDGLV
jgi:hypothetical protein